MLEIFLFLFIICITAGYVWYYIAFMDSKKNLVDENKKKPIIALLVNALGIVLGITCEVVLSSSGKINDPAITILFVIGMCIVVYLLCFLKYNINSKAYHQYYKFKIALSVLFILLTLVSFIGILCI